MVELSALLNSSLGSSPKISSHHLMPPLNCAGTEVLVLKQNRDSKCWTELAVEDVEELKTCLFLVPVIFNFLFKELRDGREFLKTDFIF